MKDPKTSTLRFILIRSYYRVSPRNVAVRDSNAMVWWAEGRDICRALRDFVAVRASIPLRPDI
jgi:hypothetical protein